MDNPYQAPSGRLLSTFTVFLAVLVVLYSLFLLFEKFSLNRSISSIQGDQKNVEQELAGLRNDQVQTLYTAQELKDKVADQKVAWSKVVKQLQDLTPVTVFFSSYHLSKDGSLQLGGLGDNYGSVSDVIANLKKSELFSNVFVPTVTLGSTSGGQAVVSFAVQVNSALQ
jgi:Tfp pilus assembly protein PilN